MTMTNSFFRFRALPAVLTLAAALLFVGTGPAQAQSSSGGSSSEYETMFNEARQTAQQAVQDQQSENIDGAVEKYEAAYRQLSEAADLAQQDGQVEAANQITALAAKLAYRAGSALHNAGRSQEAISHFEFGQEIAPPSYNNNTSGLQAARNSLKQGPVVDASRALSEGNPSRAIQLLSELDEQTATSYFYQALAQQELGNSQRAISAAQSALGAGGLSTSRQRRLYLTIGEEQMKTGNNDAARESLQQAANMGSDRATALIEQL